LAWPLVRLPQTRADEKGGPSSSPQPAPFLSSQASQPRLLEAYGKLPLSFEANQGQADKRVKFLSRGRGYALFLTGDEAVFSLGGSLTAQAGQKSGSVPIHRDGFHEFFDWRTAPIYRSATGKNRAADVERATPAVLRMKLAGANPAAKIEGLDKLPGKSNYFIGNDPKKWRTNVPHYARVRYREVYPGVDVVYHGNSASEGQLEHDFIVAPGADPKAIRFTVAASYARRSDSEGTSGERSSPLQVAANGDLVIRTDAGEVRFRKPVAYQPRVWKSGSLNSPFTIQNSEFVDGRYVLLADNRVGFEVAAYDKTKPLVIDPVILVYSTYLGHDTTECFGIAVDSSGNAYVTGVTTSTIPTTASPFQAIKGTVITAFVTKFNAAGNALIYSTYLGGNSFEQGVGIAVDSLGNAFVTGSTSSTNFPTSPGAFQTVFGGSGCAFPLGALCTHAFMTELNPTGTGLVYSTYLGGTSVDTGGRVAVDSSGNAYVTGATFSTNFPTTPSAFQTTLSGGTCGFAPFTFTCPNAFVTKLNTNASGSASLVYSTYLGGSGSDGGFGIAVDGSGNAYVTGQTFSTNFPTTPSAFQTTFGGGTCGIAPFTFTCRDAFVTKLNTNASGPASLVYSTYLGGSGDDEGPGIAVDSSGNAYVTGFTSSTNFPTTDSAFQTTFGGGPFDAFVTKLNATGTGLVYSTYLGGSGQDFGSGIAVDSSGNAFVTGFTFSTNFPTTAGAFQAALGGFFDAFVTKLNAAGNAPVYSTYLGGSFGDLGLNIAVDSSGSAYVTGFTFSLDFPTIGAIQPTGGGRVAFVTKFANATLTPAQAISDLINTVTALGFQQAINLLENALNQLNAGHITATCGDLGAFIHQVQAQSGKQLTPDQASSLIASANDIRASLGCP